MRFLLSLSGLAVKALGSIFSTNTEHLKMLPDFIIAAIILSKLVGCKLSRTHMNQQTSVMKLFIDKMKKKKSRKG